MQPNHMALRRIVLLVAFVATFPVIVIAQQARTPARITEAINEAQLTRLPRNTHPLARAEFDRGAAVSSLPLDRMLLVLQRSPEQEAALRALLDQQQDKSSPNYHAWLTPEQFGQQFGPADEDIQSVTAWLESHGFRVNRVTSGRGAIEFSGTAGQLQAAFHTEIHRYGVNGEEHWANASDPQIPSALSPVVVGVQTLHNFFKKPQIVMTGEQFKAKFRPGSLPEFSTSSGIHALAPGDFAIIYNVNPLYSAGTNGTGTVIAVVGRSKFDPQDVVDFRNAFLLPNNQPVVIVNGADPGIVSTGEQAEATLDATWSGAVAPNAQISFVVSASTNTTDGVDLSELYIVDNDLGNVMTESFGGCEAGATAADAAAISGLAEQAAAEGITYMVSTGDAGAEGCDNPNTETSATGPISVNILASTPFTIGVGGTAFNEGSNTAKYWSASNSSGGVSALSYIPEKVWNESCNSGCGQGGSGAIWAGGGGASTLFQKPVWQAAVTGIPADGARDLPDVSLSAAAHDPYLMCFQGSCGSGFFAGVSGTSASTPSFAAIMALVSQKTNSKQGQANYVLYRLAAQETLSSCNGSSSTTLPPSNCIFNDTTLGNNAVPGEAGFGTPGAKYQSTVGYDLATGLGSVNVANLVNNWGNARSTNSVVSTFTLNPTTSIQHGTTPVSFNVAVTPQSGTGTPTGDVSVIAQVGIDGLPTPVTGATLVNGSVSGTTKLLPGGTYTVIAHYEGDGTFLPSDSSPPIQVTVTPESSSTVISAFQGSIGNPTGFASGQYGAAFAVNATVTGQSGNGVPTGNVGFLLDGSPVSATFFPTLSSTGQAVLPSGFFFPPPGQHSITAKYNGDSSFNASTSNAVSVAITQAPTQTSLQSSSSSALLGQTVTLTATVTAASGGNAPTGTANFFSGQTSIGSQTLSVSSGSNGTLTATATLSTSQLPAGQESITAQYGGDTNYQSSTSLAIPVSIGSSFIISANPTSIVVGSPGSSGSTSLTFQAAAGFIGSATLSPSMCSNLPPHSSCSFNPSMVAFTSTATSSVVTMTISTQATSSAAPSARRFMPRSPVAARRLAFIFATGICFLLFARRRQLRWNNILAAILLAAMASFAGCGGGGGGTNNTPPQTNGTPVGIYTGVTVTVTINGATQSISNLSVSVQ